MWKGNLAGVSSVLELLQDMCHSPLLIKMQERSLESPDDATVSWLEEVSAGWRDKQQQKPRVLGPDMGTEVSIEPAIPNATHQHSVLLNGGLALPLFVKCLNFLLEVRHIHIIHCRIGGAQGLTSSKKIHANT